MRPVARAIGLAAVLSVALVAEGGEPPDLDTWLLPGRAAGTIQSRWVAPYVQETQVRVGDGWATDVRWFHPDGSILRETHGKSGATDAEAGVVRGIRDTWAVRLRGPWQDSTILRGEDDSTLVHYWNDADAIRSDIYKDGILVRSVGPYPRFQGKGFVLGEDGSMAVLTLKEPGSTSVRVVVFAPEGEPSFEAEAGGDAWIVSVAPGGLGVVLRGNAKPYVENELTWLSKKGTSRTLKIEPNPEMLAWVPGTTREIVTYGLAGTNPRFRLVDWESGTALWDVADPAQQTCSRLGGVAIEGDLILLAGIEDGCRTAQALELGTGSLVARWSGGSFGEPGLPAPRFMRLDGKLWLVADDAFAVFPVEDVRKKAGRWR